MVKLNFNLVGFSFQRSITILTTSFTAAGDGLAGSIAAARAAAAAHREHVRQGGPWVGEVDDDGVVVWDQADLLDYEVTVAEEAAMELRKAYMIALYHHWERSVRLWTGSSGLRKHEELAEATRAKGYPVHPKLEAVRDLVNTLKHENDRWGLPLIKSWPEVFPPNFRPRSAGKTYWFEVIELSDALVHEAFTIVSASGPTKDMV